MLTHGEREQIVHPAQRNFDPRAHVRRRLAQAEAEPRDRRRRVFQQEECPRATDAERAIDRLENHPQHVIEGELGDEQARDLMESTGQDRLRDVIGVEIGFGDVDESAG